METCVILSTFSRSVSYNDIDFLQFRSNYIEEELPFLQSILLFSITYCMPPMAIKRKLLPKKRKTKIRLCSKDRSSTFYTFLTPFLVGYKVLWQQSEAVKAKPHLKFGSFVLLLDIKRWHPIEIHTVRKYEISRSCKFLICISRI